MTNHTATLGELPMHAGFIDHAGIVHREATIGDLTACGHYADSTAEPVTTPAVTCAACNDAVTLAGELDGNPDDLRVLAGAALLRADQLDPAGGCLPTEED